MAYLKTNIDLSVKNMYTHGDKSHGEHTNRGERYIDPINKGTEILLSKLEKINAPIMTHWEVYAWDRDWPRFRKVYLNHRNIKFIIPHMAFGSPEQVDLIFSNNPNVYMTLSKKLKKKGGYSDSSKQARPGSSILDDNKIIRSEWKPILMKYQDRILFATYAHKAHRWKKYKKIVKMYRKLADQLPVEVAKKISYLNAEKLYGVYLE